MCYSALDRYCIDARLWARRRGGAAMMQVRLMPERRVCWRRGGDMESLVKRELLSRRVRAVKPSGIRKFFDIAASMPDVISLVVGEPDFVTPENIRQAGIASIQHGDTHYTSNYGTLELRQAIADLIARR